MLNKKIIYAGIPIFVLAVSHIILAVQIHFQKKSIGSLEKSLVDYQQYMDSQIMLISECMNSISQRQDENKNEIQHDLSMIKRKSESQFSKTVGMSKTYDAILVEQKKKTIDTAEKETAFIKDKKDALDAYKKGNYSVAYEDFNKLVGQDSDDMECRAYKAKSLYYKNPGDSSRYSEILADIKILNQNAWTDEEIVEIAKLILAEKEGFNE